MRAEPLYDSLNRLFCLFCYVFHAIVICDHLCKVPAVVVYKKSRGRLIRVLFASIFAI